jgi:hypothetical protein
LKTIVLGGGLEDLEDACQFKESEETNYGRLSEPAKNSTMKAMHKNFHVFEDSQPGIASHGGKEIFKRHA